MHSAKVRDRVLLRVFLLGHNKVPVPLDLVADKQVVQDVDSIPLVADRWPGVDNYVQS